MCYVYYVSFLKIQKGELVTNGSGGASLCTLNPSAIANWY